MKVGGVILAAGASTRMGRPKALLDLWGECFLDRLIGVLGSACHPVVVVLGRQAGEIRARLTRPAQFVLNPAPERGMLSSLQCGLAALPADSAALFTPVDHPAVLPSTAQALARALKDGQSPLVVPAAEGKRGHPVGLGRPLIEEMLGLPPTAQARELIHQHLDSALVVEVDDPGILEDVDDPEAYRRLLARGKPA